jgi:hypothetical protein
MMKAAGKAAPWLREIAASKHKRPRDKFGKLGPASEVRIIDPKDYKPDA